MIQTKLPIEFGDRAEKNGLIKIEVRLNDSSRPDGNEYLVIDWDLNDTNNAYFSKKVFWNNVKMDEVKNYLYANYDFSGLSKKDSDYLEMVLALMLDTQTNLLPSGKTIYRQTPSSWEFSPEIVDKFGDKLNPIE